MAHFRATIQGNRGEASRLGTKKTGLQMTLNGWHIGIVADIMYNIETNKDEIRLYVTAGSNNGQAQYEALAHNDNKGKFKGVCIKEI